MVKPNLGCSDGENSTNGKFASAIMYFSAEKSSQWMSMHVLSNITMLECWNRTKDEVVWWRGNWTNWAWAMEGSLLMHV